MKQLFFTLVLIILLNACNEKGGSSTDGQVYKITEDSIETKLDTSTMLVISSPDIFENSDNVIFTTHYRTLHERRGFIEKISSGSLDSYSGEHYSNDTRNVIFSNIKTGESHLLCDTNLFISSISYIFPDTAKYFDSEIHEKDRFRMQPLYILYSIRLRDWNNDESIDGSDPTTLFISGANGENFIPLMKPDENLWGWSLTADKKQIILQVHEDTNHDLEFNEKDKLSVRIIDLQSPSYGKNYFNRELLRKLYQLDPKSR